MRSAAFAALLASISLIACVSGGADDEGAASEQDLASDGGTTATDSGTTSTSDSGASTSDSGASTSDGGAPAVPTYAQVGPVINSVCGRCHTGKFNSLDKVKANKDRMLTAISSGRMPKNDPSWRTTAAGRSVLDFLANSPELQ